MPKVIPNKSTKIKSKGFILAGVEVEVTADEKKLLEKGGFLSEIKKDNSPNSDKEISALVAKVAELEKGADKKLKADNDNLKKDNENLAAKITELEKGTDESLKKENEELRKELVELAGDKEEHKGLLEKWGFKK